MSILKSALMCSCVCADNPVTIGDVTLGTTSLEFVVSDIDEVGACVLLGAADSTPTPTANNDIQSYTGTGKKDFTASSSSQTLRFTGLDAATVYTVYCVQGNDNTIASKTAQTGAQPAQPGAQPAHEPNFLIKPGCCSAMVHTNDLSTSQSQVAENSVCCKDANCKDYVPGKHLPICKLGLQENKKNFADDETCKVMNCSNFAEIEHIKKDQTKIKLNWIMEIDSSGTENQVVMELECEVVNGSQKQMTKVMTATLNNISPVGDARVTQQKLDPHTLLTFDNDWESTYGTLAPTIQGKCQFKFKDSSMSKLIDAAGIRYMEPVYPVAECMTVFLPITAGQGLLQILPSAEDGDVLTNCATGSVNAGTDAAADVNSICKACTANTVPNAGSTDCEPEVALGCGDARLL